MDEIRRGGVYWIEAAALRPHVPGAAHPHVVLQDDLFNRSRVPTVVVCAVSSQLRRAEEPGGVLLEPGEGGLPRRSVAVASRLCVVDKADLGEHLGQLSEARVAQILAGLRFVQRLRGRGG